MSNDPLSIPLSRVLDHLRQLGLDPVNPSDLSSVLIEPDRIEVVRYRRSDTGQMLIAGLGVATETTVIRIGGDDE